MAEKMTALTVIKILMNDISVKHSMVSITLLAALVCAGQTNDAAPKFAIHEIKTGVAVHQTLLTGHFGPGMALAVVNTDASGATSVKFYGFDGGHWSRMLDAPLDVGTLFVDAVRGADRDRLVAYRRGGVYWFDTDSRSERLVAEISMTFRAPGEGMPLIDIGRDLNHDGLDDLVIPDIDGFRIAVQWPDGTFAAPARYGPPEPFLGVAAHGANRTYREVGITPENFPWYMGRLHQLDYDRDGRTDIAFWRGDRFDLYRQEEKGTFHSAPDTFETDVPFDFDGTYALAFQTGDASPASMLLGLGARREHKVLKGFQDVNADGVADILILTLRGRSPLRLRGRFAIHFGRPVPGGTAFAAEPDTVVDTPGRSAGGEPWGYASHRFDDFEGDGDIDAMLSAVDTSGGGMLRAIAGNAVSIDLAFYRLRDGTYPERPDATRRVKSPFRPLSRRGPLFPAVLLGDVDGDGVKDLVVGDRWNELSVFLGSTGPDPFAAPPIKIPVTMPAAGDLHVRLADVDRDGRQDVVIHHRSDTAENRVVVVTAR